MGRFAEASAPLTFADALAVYAAGLGELVAETEWYLFGSALRSPDCAADIDLLILCGSDDVADRIRSTVDPHHLALPIDLTLLTFEEETELGFIQRQQAARVFPLDR